MADVVLWLETFVGIGDVRNFLAVVAECNAAKRRIMNVFLRWWNLAVGSMDACTGLLLMVAPELTLRLMGLQSIGAEAQVFLSWMGAFVFAVGVSYFLALRDETSQQGEIIWKITALVRAVIACFVVTKVVQGSLELLWLSVAATDALVALVQVIGINKRWWQK